MNKDLEYLLSTGDVVRKRTLRFFFNRTHTQFEFVDCDWREGSIPVGYTTQYEMNSALGPFKWYLTWLDPECPDYSYASSCSIRLYKARARTYFPAYLDTRIPPENRVDLREILDRFGLEEYDKFDLVKATKAYSPIKLGNVCEVEPLDCPYDDIHEIEEIVKEYQRVLG